MIMTGEVVTRRGIRPVMKLHLGGGFRMRKMVTIVIIKLYHTLGFIFHKVCSVGLVFHNVGNPVTIGCRMDYPHENYLVCHLSCIRAHAGIYTSVLIHAHLDIIIYNDSEQLYIKIIKALDINF